MSEGASPDIAEMLAAAIGHHRAGRLGEAEGLYRRILACDPRHADSLHLLGVIAYQSQRLDRAVTLIGQAIALNPKAASYHSNLGGALADQGRLDEAVACYRRALLLRPDYPESIYNLGGALKDQGRLDEAETCYRQALIAKPDYAEAHNNLGLVLAEAGRLEEAVACYRKALALKPDFPEAHANLGNALKDKGRPDEAVACYRQALEKKPDYAAAYSNLLFLHAGQEGMSGPDYLALARGWERACVPEPARADARRRAMARRPAAGVRLRVGYVSGDFNRHPVSYFIAPVLAHHDRGRIEVFAYPTAPRRDDVTGRIERSADHWVPLMGLSDEAARRRIEADGIDVLIDLSGHTSGHRLGVFARRAAPVQAHYLGFFASTGLTEMDYWIGDSVVTPPAAAADFSETLWRLPRLWSSYDAKAEAPAPAWRPAADGTVWLGGFHRVEKLTRASIALWSRILAALPEGRLLLKTKALADAETRRRLLAAFAAEGIEIERIELEDSRATPDWRSHMAYYDRLDIALDPIGGESGATTTCDALWMGVPVIGLAGQRMATRMTGAMLTALGRPEFLAGSEDDYVAKTVALARDVALRRALRASQRARMAESPLCDAAGLARALEDAFAAMALKH